MTDVINYTPPITENVSVKFYLTFPTQAEAEAVINGLEGYSIDIIGEDERYPNQYMVNLLGPETDVWDANRVYPETPIRVFA